MIESEYNSILSEKNVVNEVVKEKIIEKNSTLKDLNNL